MVLWYNALVHTKHPMTSAKDTYEFCESFIQKEIDNIFVTISHWSRECADHNEEFISLKRRKSEELKNLYKHLDNIQQLKAPFQ